MGSKWLRSETNHCAPTCNKRSKEDQGRIKGGAREEQEREEQGRSKEQGEAREEGGARRSKEEQGGVREEQEREEGGGRRDEG